MYNKLITVYCMLLVVVYADLSVMMRSA
jgi:hypothetical protein